MMAAEHPEREQVMAFLDGELPGAAAADLDAHLKACAACRSFAGELRAVSRRLAGWRVEAAPTSFDGRIDAAAHAAQRGADVPLRQRRGWTIPRLRWRWEFAPAAVVVVLVVALALPLRRSRTAEGKAESRYAMTETVAVAPAPGQRVAPPGSQIQRESVANVGALIARTASLRLIVADIDEARATLTRLVASHRGAIAQLAVSGERPAVRTIAATAKVPADELDDALAAVRSIGRVLDETQGSEDVTAQSVDLDARLANARRTEQRLATVVQNARGR
jgi:hypothetical protein